MDDKPVNKGGRPRKILDEDQVYALASIGCTVLEIAQFFRVSIDVIKDNYSEPFREGYTEVKMSVRRKQLEIALGPVSKGQPAMLIWLGKQMLGQREPRADITETDNGAIAQAIVDALPVIKLHAKKAKED